MLINQPIKKNWMQGYYFQGVYGSEAADSLLYDSRNQASKRPVAHEGRDA